MDEDGELEFFNKKRPGDRENCYKVIRKYYNHKGSTDFHRMALFLEGMLLMCVMKIHIILLAVVSKSPPNFPYILWYYSYFGRGCLCVHRLQCV